MGPGEGTRHRRALGSVEEFRGQAPQHCSDQLEHKGLCGLNRHPLSLQRLPDPASEEHAKKPLHPRSRSSGFSAGVRPRFRLLTAGATWQWEWREDGDTVSKLLLSPHFWEDLRVHHIQGERKDMLADVMLGG